MLVVELLSNQLKKQNENREFRYKKTEWKQGIQTYLQSFAKNIVKIEKVKKKLQPQAKYWQNMQWEATLQLPPTIDNIKT